MSLTINILSFRYGHLAAQCIESVLSQSLRPVCVRVWDDGAGDCAHLRALYPAVEIIEHPRNLGIVPNINGALERTETEWCMMLGADNYLRPDALAKLATRSPYADIISSDIAIFGENAEAFRALAGATETRDGFGIWRFTRGNISLCNYIHGSSLYRTYKAKTAGGYRASGRENSEEDWMLWRAMLARGARHEHASEPLLYYRRHGRNFQK